MYPLRALGLGGWRLACLPVQAPALIGAGIVVGLLSFHEIEAAVQIQPPGAGNLARRLLDYLHYARLQDLSAAAVLLIGSGVTAALAAAWLCGIPGWLRKVP